MSILNRIAEGTSKYSIPTRLRLRRFRWFEKMITDAFPERVNPVRILDFGGTASYWNQVYNMNENPLNLEITLLNLRSPKNRNSCFKYIEANAMNLSEFAENQYECGFSNSMIEHVGDFVQQEKCIKEIIRVSKTQYIQSPNLCFFWEPHYNLPFVHWFATPIRMRLLSLLMLKPLRTQYESYLSNPVNLLSLSQIKYLFPSESYKIYHEKILIFTKSFVVCSRNLSINEK